jgi:ABC-type nickel/cobalt efflux system permease component RcnA
MWEALIAACVGLLWGARHAFEPDHLAAVSTLAADRRDARAPWTLGALWGLGHSLALLALAGALAVLELAMPPQLTRWLELLVAAMLLLLGARALWQAWDEGRTGRPATHAHGALLHAHAAPVEHVHLRSWTLATRPLWIGLLHGLAGSGALTALVLAELHSAAARLSYIALFGVGSTLGMALMTSVLGASFSRLGASRWLLGAAGTGSMVLGVVWAFQAAA